MNDCAIGDHRMRQDVLLAVNHELWWTSFWICFNYTWCFWCSVTQNKRPTVPATSTADCRRNGKELLCKVGFPVFSTYIMVILPERTSLRRQRANWNRQRMYVSCRMYKSLPSQSSLCLKSCTCVCVTREIFRSLQVHAICKVIFWVVFAWKAVWRACYPRKTWLE